MRLTSLHYFLVVAQELNISKAAQRLYITQQSLSEHIARLESEYNVKLFDRTPRLRLTYAGKRMVVFAQEVLSQERRFTNEMADMSLNNHGSLSLGVRNAYSRIVVPRLLSPYVKSHPNIRLHVVFDTGARLAQKLSDGQIDLALGGSRHMNDPCFISTLLVEDRYCMVVPENILNNVFHLTKEDIRAGVPLDFSRLSQAPLIVIQANGATRSAANYFLSSHKILSPNVIMECQNNEAAIIASASGLGISFVIEQIYQHFIQTTKEDIPLFNFPFHVPSLSNYTTASYHRNRPLSQAGLDFIELAKDLFSQH